MALHGCSSVSRAARSSYSVVSIGASDPSSPKDLSLPPQEPDRTHALSFYVTCDSCAVVLWVRAVCSDCFSLLRALHKSPPNELDRHAPSERGLLGHPSQCSQLWPVKTISIVDIRRMSHHHVSAFGASPGHHCHRCQPFTVQITFSRRMRGIVHGTSIARRVVTIIQRVRKACLHSDIVGFPEVC